MRIARRLLAAAMCALAALAMCVGLAGTAWGEGDDATTGAGSITIQNAAAGKTYNVYKVFDLSLHMNGSDADSYLYTISSGSPWYRFFSEGAGKSYVTLNLLADSTDTYVVTWNDSTNSTETSEDFNKAIFEYLDSKATGSSPISATGFGSSQNGGELTISGLSYGYYLVQSELGALISLDSTNPIATVKDKNSVPTLSKFVKEGEDWVTANDASIGDTVTFRLVIDVKYGARNFTIEDVLSDGFTFDNGSVKVWCLNDGSSEAAGVVASGNLIDVNLIANTDDNVKYSVTQTATSPDKFNIVFAEAWLQSLGNDSWIVVEYQAAVNAEATIATKDTANEAVNSNTAILHYGENQSTVAATTTTHVWSIPVHKFYKTTSADDLGLADAVFTLKKQGSENNLKFVSTSESGNDQANAVYRLALSDEVSDEANISDKFTTPSSGNLTFQGLDSGTYILTEVEAPDGFNKLSNPLTVTVDRDGSIKVDGSADIVNTVKVENNTGTELPSTGGMGTTVIYVAGGLLVAAAVVLLVAKKKVSADDK